MAKRPPSAHPALPAPPSAPARERVAARAYAIYLARGGGHGRHVEDWLQAEREVAQQAQAPAARPKADIPLGLRLLE